MKILQVTYSISVVIVLLSCTEANGYLFAGGNGRVQIYYDSSVYALPVLDYHFYNNDMQKEIIVRSSDSVGNFEGSLPVGTYRVIATNTIAENVWFRNLENHELAAVSLTPLQTEKAYAPPGKVYSTVVNELQVSATRLSRYPAVPALLTRRVKFVFSFNGRLVDRVIALSGELPGVYPVVDLYTQTCREEATDQGTRMSIVFNTGVNANVCETQVNLFGLRNPDYGRVYTNNLLLKLTLNDESVVNILVDMTKVLSDIINEHNGVLPHEFTIPIDLSHNSMGVVGKVTGWIVEGTMDNSILD